MRYAFLTCLLSLQVFAAEPAIEKLDLFAGGEGGSALYRIPGIVVTTKGTVLAYSEARRKAGSDWARSKCTCDAARTVARRGRHHNISRTAVSALRAIPTSTTKKARRSRP